MKTLIIAFICFISVNVFSQNITNTLGTNGLFTIKDSSNNYLTLNQATGELNILRSLRLENTTSSGLGTIFKGAESFLHNYQAPGTDGFNTFLGISAGNFTMSGNIFESSLNTGIGYSSLFSITYGSSNTAVGTNSLYSNTEGNYNTALGNHSLYLNISGNRNTAVGDNSLYLNSYGNYNTAMGNHSLYLNTDGHFNTAVGLSSLYSNSSGQNNTAVGCFSISGNTTGSNNTALGYITGESITTGNNLTCLGYNAEPSSGTSTNQITLGNGSITSLRCNITTITSLSDARDKKNIKDLSLGLDFLMKIKPRLFNWDKREWYENNISDGTKVKEEPTAGFIAQELDEVQTTENAEWLNLVLKDNPEKLEATSGNLLPVMVKAIQELKVENEKLKVQSEKLKVENVELRNNDKKLSSELESLKTLNEKVVKLEKIVNELTSVKYTSLNKLNENKTIQIKGNEK